MAHNVKYGDARTLEWQLNADLTTATGVRVIISKPGKTPPIIDRAGSIVDAPTGIVSLTLSPADYGDGLLQAGMSLSVEVEVSPGPVTHPDCGFEELNICYDLG